MARPPRDPHAPILDPILTRRVLFSGVLMALSATGLFLYEYRHEVVGVGHEMAVAEARTMAVTTVILFQMVYLLRCRTTTGKFSEILRPGNPWVLIGIAALAVAHALYVYWPLLQDVFRSQGLNADAWIKCGLVTAALVPVFLLDALWESRKTR